MFLHLCNRAARIPGTRGGRKRALRSLELDLKIVASWMPEIEAWPSASVASDLNGGPISPSPVVDILTEPIQSCDPSNAENLS